MADNKAVQVALRIRPLTKSEIKRRCQKCLKSVSNENRLQVIGIDRTFTFNYVCNETTSQELFYENAAKQMIDNLFKGYNVNILAYGQTGAGKTYSMGTNYYSNREMGIIPRAVMDIFNYITHCSDRKFKVSVSFMELYQENLYDLLSTKSRDQCVVDIREGTTGIRIPGLVEKPVWCFEDTIKCLIDGSAGRATGATAMNAQSSRSHAIFTITIKQQKGTNTATTSKFHLIDLAGSEYSTKTADKEFKDVIIHKSLLSLGNVLSGPSDDSQQGFICYHDSKLTRLLRGSLGSNSKTLVIACVSPADSDVEETINTLQFANRAKNIKNKSIVNQNPMEAKIASLHQVIQQLRLKNLTNRRLPINMEKIKKIRQDNIDLQNKNRELNTTLSSAVTANTNMLQQTLLSQSANKTLLKQINVLLESYRALNAQLATQMKANANLLENKSRIDAQDNQLQQFKQAQSNTANSKLDEKKRKREKEIETQITNLKRKVTEQTRIIQTKKANEVEMKQTLFRLCYVAKNRIN